MRRRRAVTPPTVSLSMFTLREQLMFVSGWTPDMRATRWASWREYLDDFVSVRDELVTRYRTGPRASFPRPFADRALDYRQRHGIQALEHASYSDIKYGSEGED